MSNSCDYASTDSRRPKAPIRYTSLALNVCELATSNDPWESLSTLDDAVALGATPRWINHVACELVSGRDGVALIARATRPGASDEFRSWLERAAAHIFALGGLPSPQWNVPVHDDRGRIGVVDALWLPERVVCELKGLRFHGTATQVRHDDKRLNRLLDAGYHARSLGWRDLVDDPRGSVQTVMRAMRAGGAAVDLDRVPAEITLPRAPFTGW